MRSRFLSMGMRAVVVLTVWVTVFGVLWLMGLSLPVVGPGWERSSAVWTDEGTDEGTGAYRAVYDGLLAWEAEHADAMSIYDEYGWEPERLEALAGVLPGVMRGMAEAEAEVEGGASAGERQVGPDVAQAVRVHAAVALNLGDARFVRAGMTPGASAVQDMLALVRMSRRMSLADAAGLGFMCVDDESRAWGWLSLRWRDLGPAGWAALETGLAALPAAVTLADEVRAEHGRRHGTGPLRRPGLGWGGLAKVLGYESYEMREVREAAFSEALIAAASGPMSGWEAGFAAVEAEALAACPDEAGRELVRRRMERLRSDAARYRQWALERAQLRAALAESLGRGGEARDPVTGGTLERVVLEEPSERGDWVSRRVMWRSAWVDPAVRAGERAWVGLRFDLEE